MHSYSYIGPIVAVTNNTEHAQFLMTGRLHFWRFFWRIKVFLSGCWYRFNVCFLMFQYWHVFASAASYVQQGFLCFQFHHVPSSVVMTRANISILLYASHEYWHFWEVITSDVNKDFGPKDTGHKAKALGYQGQGLGSQGQGLEMSRPITF